MGLMVNRIGWNRESSSWRGGLGRNRTQYRGAREVAG